jgi:hypothetical protein
MKIDTTLLVEFRLDEDERFIVDDPWLKGDLMEVRTIKVDLLADDGSTFQVHAEGAKVRKDGKGTKGASWHLAVLTDEQEAHWLKLAREHWEAQS